jgi:uncharacterized protein YndB with AHSA1/START domain
MKTIIVASVFACSLASVGVVAVSAAGERSWRDFKDVSNSSFVEPGGDRAIQLSVEVPAPRQAVFDAFATSDGFSSWAVPVAHVDLRVGGVIEASYDSKSTIGNPANIKNQIVAYVPERLLVIRNLQAPPGFADPELFRRTVTIIEFTPIDAAHTRVTLTNAGYGPGDGFKELYEHFEWGDAYTLAELRSRFEKGPVDWAAREARAKAREATKVVEGTR